jgi:hypothetical protein
MVFKNSMDTIKALLAFSSQPKGSDPPSFPSIQAAYQESKQTQQEAEEEAEEDGEPLSAAEVTIMTSIGRSFPATRIPLLLPVLSPSSPWQPSPRILKHLAGRSCKTIYEIGKRLGIAVATSEEPADLEGRGPSLIPTSVYPAAEPVPTAPPSPHHRPPHRCIGPREVCTTRGR